MAITVVQTAPASPPAFGDNTADTVYSFGSLPASGSAILSLLSGFAASPGYTLNTWTDNQSGSYTTDKSNLFNSAINAFLGSRLNISAPSGTFTITAHTTGLTTPFAAAGAIEVTGLLTSAAFDSGSSGTATATGTSITVTGGTCAQADNLHVACVCGDTGSGTAGFTTPSGWTQLWVSNNGAAHAVGWAGYKIVTGSTAAPTATWSGLVSQNLTAVIGVYKATAGNPNITLVNPRLFYDGQTSISILGSSFGASQGAGTVKISPTDNVADGGAITQTVTAWGDTSITFTAVRSSLGFGTLYLFVTENGGTSNTSGYPVQFIGTANLAWYKA